MPTSKLLFQGSILVGFLLSQPVLTQGQSFDHRRVRDQSFRQKITVIGPKGAKLNEALMQTTVRVDSRANRLYHLRRTTGGRLDSTVCRLSDLKPLYFSAQGEGMNFTTEYGTGQVKAFARFGPEQLADGTYPVSEPIYDTFMDTYLVSLMPLEEGFQGRFNLFRSDLAKETAFVIQSVSRESIPNEQGVSVPAYRVACENAGVQLMLWYSVAQHDLLRVVIQLPNGGQMIREMTTAPWPTRQQLPGYEVYNRTISQQTEAGKPFVRLSEGGGAGLAWLTGKSFTEGTIEVDIRGRDEFQRSFVGVAFHGVDERTYESVYFRPFNFQATDPVRKIHAVQYVFEPQFGFQQLRDTRKDEFEAAILPPTVLPTDWFHARLVVKGGRIRVFVNDSLTPALDVPTLNPNPLGTKVGLMVGNNSNGDFANLTLKP
jgi:hypothetical protein